MRYCKAIHSYPTQYQRGIALVTVLWLIALLSIVAAGHSRNARLETRLAARYIEMTKARYVADAATQLVIARLLNPVTDQQLAVDGRLIVVNVGDRDAYASIRRANGLVDINTASEPVLRTMFIAAGADGTLADALAARVLDWRDTDGFTHLAGAEDSDYMAAGIAWTARDGRFSSVDELRYVLGITPEIFRAVSPYLTVYSSMRGIDFNVAPEFLVRAFEAHDKTVSRYSTNAALPPGVRGGSGTFHINVAVPGADGVFASTESVVRVARNAQPQFAILSWRNLSRLLTQTADDPRRW